MLEWEEYKGFWLAEYALASFWIEKGYHDEQTYYASVMVGDQLNLMTRTNNIYDAKVLCEYWRESIIKSLEETLAKTQ